jgi:DNA-directed RNA polymerase subunit RPC12/RpoP
MAKAVYVLIADETRCDHEMAGPRRTINGKSVSRCARCGHEVVLDPETNITRIVKPL